MMPRSWFILGYFNTAFSIGCAVGCALQGKIGYIPFTLIACWHLEMIKRDGWWR